MPFNQARSSVTLRAAGSRPYGGVYDKQQFIHVLTQSLFCMIDGLSFIPFFYLYSPLIFPGKDGKIESDRKKYILEVRQ